MIDFHYHNFTQHHVLFSSIAYVCGPTEFFEGVLILLLPTVSKLDRKHCRMLVGLLTRHINLQYMLHKMSMQEMRCRKGNVGTHSMRMLNVGKGEDADLGLCQDGSGTNKRDDAERDRGSR